MSTRIRRTTICSIVLPMLLVAGVAVERSAAADRGQAPRETGRVRTKQLNEVSGMVASRHQPDILWMHNDGDAKVVYAVRPSGQVMATVRIPAGCRDVEDIAIGPGPREGVDYLYLGDIGDNDEERSEIRVLRFAEPTVQTSLGGHRAATNIEEFRLTYPDGPHNAESLLVDPLTGDVLIVTKEKKRARVYTVRGEELQDKKSTTLKKVATLKSRYVSGGDISRDGSRIVLRRESRGWLWPRLSSETVADALRRSPQAIPVKSADQGLNGEAIALVGDGSRYYTISEGDRESICLFSIVPVAETPGADR